MLTLSKRVQAVAKCRNKRYLYLLAPLSLLFTICWSQPSEAQTRLGLACLGNKVGSTINFQYRFGSGSWNSTTVRQGYWRKLEYWYEFPDQNSGPPLSVRFDADMSGSTYYVTQTLDQYAVRNSDCNSGRQYDFYRRGNRLYLESIK